MTSSIEDRGVDVAAALAAMTPPEPAPGLSARVLQRIDERGRPRTAPRRRFVVGALLAALAALGTLAVIDATSPVSVSRSAGVWQGAERATLRIGTRGVAVAEPGAHLTWEAAHARVRVEQHAGTTFYRVETGAPFQVVTPAGTVTVTGTCFSVEVRTMKSSHRTAVVGAAGAAIATLVVVTVYEGRVLLANERGEVAVTAGQHGQSELGNRRPPVVGPSLGSGTDVDGASTVASDPVGAAAPTAGADVARLRTRVGELERRLAQASTMVDELRREAGVAPRVAPTKDQLVAWARNCEIHIDTPDVFGATPARLDADQIRRWGLEPNELPIMDEALALVHADARVELRRLYLEATGDTAGADQLSPSAMYQEIVDKAAPGTLDVARRRMALERAGLAQPPADLRALPPAEQAYRLFERLGHQFEELLADRLGRERARALRERWNGWPGMRFDSSGCPSK